MAAPTTLGARPVTGADDAITVSIRLDDDVALKLAMFAHEARMTMNALVVDVLAVTAEAWELRRRGSRNGREGRYVGRWPGGHVRSASPWYQAGVLSAGLARAIVIERIRTRVVRHGQVAARGWRANP